MKVLTVKNPWALAIFHGKDIENRDWYRGIRGTVAIHASAKPERPVDYEAALYFMQRHGIDISGMRFSPTNGHILGTVEIVDCVRESDSPWFFGKYGFVLRNQKLFDKPIPAKGALGFWNWEQAA